MQSVEMLASQRNQAMAALAKRLRGDARLIQAVSDARVTLADAELEARIFDAIGPARRDEAAEVLRIGRVSWRLRDDDNLLLSRVESQLNRARAVKQLRDGDVVTVDGHLGIVTVGPPEFDMELA